MELLSEYGLEPFTIYVFSKQVLVFKPHADWHAYWTEWQPLILFDGSLNIDNISYEEVDVNVIENQHNFFLMKCSYTSYVWSEGKEKIFWTIIIFLLLLYVSADDIIFVIKTLTFCRLLCLSATKLLDRTLFVIGFPTYRFKYK